MAKKIDHLLNKKLKFSVAGSLWLECNGERFFGPGPVELLEHIAVTGSINKAAKKMGMSYKKAWKLIQSLNAFTKSPMVIVQTGGDQGGGSALTAEAYELIKYYRQLRERFAAFVKKETKALLV